MRRLALAAGVLALAACAEQPAPPAATIVTRAMPASPEPIACAIARDADFEGAGEAQLRRYLEWLAWTHGTGAGLRPDQVTLAIIRGSFKNAPAGVQVGEISCGAGEYRVMLYRDALAGRPLAVVYGTLAHEFYHVVQIRRDQLACEAKKGERLKYEREADEFASKVTPACAK
ncbi:MAG: ImmA/IrrE family metallo-endopeptidase [Gammaproteobacteria bacterium]